MKVQLTIAPQWAGVGIRGFELIERELQGHIKEFAIVKVRDFTSELDSPKLKRLGQVLEYTNELAKHTKNIVQRNEIPITIGGDHSIALGTISGVSSVVDNLGVIWIDAHGDMNTDDITPSGNIHGMILAALQGIGDKRLVNAFEEKVKIKTNNVVIFGTRDLDIKEKELMDEIGLKYFSYKEIKKQGVLESLENAISYLQKRTGKLHISFDLDVMNPTVIPGVSVPVVGGFDEVEMYDIFKTLIKSFDIKSIDIVEFNPVFDKEEKTKIFTVDLIKFLKNKLEGSL